MNFLRKISRVREQFRSNYPQYWLDAILEDYIERGYDEVNIGGTVLAILRNPNTEREIVIPGINIVTDAGDVYYAESGAGETVTNAFDQMELGDSASSAPGKSSTTSSINLIASTAQAVKATYPKTNDTGDADNTGDGVDVVTWTFEWSAASFSSSDITDGIISVSGHGVGAPVLTHFEFAAGFSKTTSDTLKVIVNHTFNGV